MSIAGRPVVITTGSMNRLGALRKALKTWMALKEVDRIFIVDWGSAVPLKQSLQDFTTVDSRICIVRVLGQKHWCNSKCHNLEMRLLEPGSLWLRLDNDTLVRKDFFERHPWKVGEFYAGNWRTVPLEIDDKRNLAGTLFIDPKYVLDVNGYNERLVHYGREDDELYARLSIRGYRWRELDLSILEHISHSDRFRYENLSIVRDLVGSDKKSIWGERKEVPDAQSMLISLSNRIIAETPWTALDRMTEWKCYHLSEQYWECRQLQGV